MVIQAAPVILEKIVLQVRANWSKAFSEVVNKFSIIQINKGDFDNNSKVRA